MSDVLLRIDLDRNDGALRSILFQRGWLPPEHARMLNERLADAEAALGDMDTGPAAETQRLLDHALKVIKQQSKTIELLLETIA